LTERSPLADRLGSARVGVGNFLLSGDSRSGCGGSGWRSGEIARSIRHRLNAKVSRGHSTNSCKGTAQDGDDLRKDLRIRCAASSEMRDSQYRCNRYGYIPSNDCVQARPETSFKGAQFLIVRSASDAIPAPARHKYHAEQVGN
jgi:hypothetical protein